MASVTLSLMVLRFRVVTDLQPSHLIVAIRPESNVLSSGGIFRPVTGM